MPHNKFSFNITKLDPIFQIQNPTHLHTQESKHNKNLGEHINLYNFFENKHNITQKKCDFNPKSWIGSPHLGVYTPCITPNNQNQVHIKISSKLITIVTILYLGHIYLKDNETPNQHFKHAHASMASLTTQPFSQHNPPYHKWSIAFWFLGMCK